MARKILIVDDDTVFCEIVTLQLRKRHPDIEFATASNGIDAMRIIDTVVASDIAVIVTDLHMPEFDGVEFMNELAQRKISAPVILVSGAAPSVFDAAQRLAKFRGVKIAASMTKPLNMDRFKEAIEKALNETD